MVEDLVEFNPEAVKAYLDRCINHWRVERSKHIDVDSKAVYYIDAFQSVRMSLFGKLLPNNKKRG